MILVGCGLAAPRNGEVVTQGVARAHFEVRAHGTDAVQVTVYFPSRPDGTPLTGPRRPGVVFIQGGFVSTTRYAWQAIALAEAGYVVAVPENELALAFFTVDFGQAARQLLAEPPAGSLLEGLVDPSRIAVGGHSLGSVVALKLALQGGFAAVVLQAGFPDPADLPQLAAFTRPSLSLAGELDCSAPLSGVKDGWAQLPAPTALVVLSGVTHFQFTGADDEDFKRGCPPQASLEAAHGGIIGALRAFLDAALVNGSVGAPGLRAIPGAAVETR